jgi:hypothetical protein
MDPSLELINVFSNISVTGIMGFFSWLIWNDRKDRQKRFDELLDKKDSQVEELHKATRDVIVENTKTQIELRNSVAVNTDVTRTLQGTLTEKIDSVLNGKRK